MPPVPRPAEAPLLSIQVLRAVAAVSVVVHHAGYDADAIAGRFGLAPLGLGRLFDWSFGINLFFVISGFIMLRSARGFGQPGATGRFLARRLLRIAPLYWLMTTLVLLGAAMAPSLLNVSVAGWGLLFGSYLFVPATRIDGEIRPILGQGWTLNYEMFFYVLFGAALWLPRRAGLMALAMLLVGLVAIGKLASPTSPPAIVWTNGLLLEFLFGLMIGLGCEAGLSLRPPTATALALAGLAAAIALGPLGASGALGALGSDADASLEPWLRQGIPAALMVAACVFAPPWPPRMFVLRLVALGDASYSIYLTHPFTIRLLRAGWSATMAGRLPVGAFLATACVAAVLVGLLVYRWVERPMTRALARRLPAAGRRSAPAPESATGAR